MVLKELEMSDEHNQSVTKKLEAFEIIHPEKTDKGHKEWIERALENLKANFDQATIVDQIRIVKLMCDYVKQKELDPMYIIERVKTLPEHKARLLLGLLQKNKIVKDIEKKADQSVFT